jgi:hypothetical protein
MKVVHHYDVLAQRCQMWSSLKPKLLTASKTASALKLRHSYRTAMYGIGIELKIRTEKKVQWSYGRIPIIHVSATL